jgi:signal transduction histidine kinase
VRTRLTLILYVPIVLVLLVLGMAYAGSVAQGKQQDVFLDRLRDASYLTIVARQSLETDDRSVVNADLHRYGEAYGISAAVLDAAGATWATNGLDAQTVDERRVALSGRRADLSTSFLPWRVNQIVVAEPVFDGGDLVGAVVTVTDASGLSRGIWVSWGVVLAAGVVLSMLAVVVADRTAVWVLRPVRAVDGAMDRISHGQLDARIPESAGPPELRQVIRRFNAMADRVEYLMGKQQEFVHNASHELRNPLSALMLRVDDLALMAPEEHPAEVGSVRAETVRMAHILDALLLLADDTRWTQRRSTSRASSPGGSTAGGCWLRDAPSTWTRRPPGSPGRSSTRRSSSAPSMQSSTTPSSSPRTTRRSRWRSRGPGRATRTWSRSRCATTVPACRRISSRG